MKSVGVFLLVGLLAIGTVLPAAWGQRAVKPGTCPPNYIVCIQAEPDECRSDFNCRGKQKCCYSRCAMRCVAPI